MEVTDRAARGSNRDRRAIDCVDPVETGARWWEWRTWEECSQELGELESNDPAACWMAAARSGGSPSEPVGILPSEVGASLKSVGRAAGWKT